MRRVLLLVLVTLLTYIVKGQEVKEMVNNRANIIASTRAQIADIDAACEEFFMKYIQENKLDSAKMIVNYWSEEDDFEGYSIGCFYIGPSKSSEKAFRARVLYDLYTNNFDETIFDKNGLRHLERFWLNNDSYQFTLNRKRYNNWNSEEFEKNRTKIDSIMQIRLSNKEINYDNFARDLAKEIATRYPEKSIENLVARFYAYDMDPLMDAMLDTKSKDYGNSVIKKHFTQKIKDTYNTSEMNFALLAGSWIPTGKLSVLGVHPEIGGQLGFKHKKMSYDVTAGMRFIHSYTKYNYWDYNKNLKNTKGYVSFYVGADIGRDIFVKNKHEVQIIGGIAYDEMRIFPRKSEEDFKKISLKSVNLNAGLSYRFYYTNIHYVGIRAKFNYVDYARSKHFDYPGNAISIQLVWGTLTGVYKVDRLHRYKQKLRE